MGSDLVGSWPDHAETIRNPGFIIGFIKGSIKGFIQGFICTFIEVFM